MDDGDNLSLIVHAVLDEMNNTKANDKIRKEQDERAIKFAKEIDKYLSINHIKRNKYLVSNNEFQRRLKK